MYLPLSLNGSVAFNWFVTKQLWTYDMLLTYWNRVSIW
jgi:hypothetical protein